MVVERLDGETIARKLLRDDEYATARRVLGAQVGEALARIHAMPSDAVEGLRQTDQLEQFRTVLDPLGEPHPAFELGFRWRSEEHTSELQSLMRISYAVFCLKKHNIAEHDNTDA